jgi:hypothetical protein
LFAVVRCCSLLFAVVRCCSLLFAVVRCCSLLFAVVHCCLLLFTVVRCYCCNLSFYDIISCFSIIPYNIENIESYKDLIFQFLIYVGFIIFNLCG